MRRNGTVGALVGIGMILAAIFVATGMAFPRSPTGEVMRGVALQPDADDDGLPDVRENNLGTDPANPDTDGDGIDDFSEDQSCTSSTNTNTDNDRRDDKEDSSPCEVNTADVQIAVETDASLRPGIGVHDVFEKLLGRRDTVTLATGTATLNLENVGDDYTKYVKVKLAYNVHGDRIHTATKNIGRLDAGESTTVRVEYEIHADILSKKSRELIKQKNIGWDAEVVNIDYERFPRTG